VSHSSYVPAGTRLGDSIRGDPSVSLTRGELIAPEGPRIPGERKRERTTRVSREGSSILSIVTRLTLHACASAIRRAAVSE